MMLTLFSPQKTRWVPFVQDCRGACAVRRTPKKASCTIKHGMRFVSCTCNVVYCIPFSCGRKYIGQTGRCLNIRLREHFSSLKGSPYSHLAMHCRQCGCQPLLTDTTVVYRNRNKVSREIVEAFLIQKNDLDCVSQPSLSLHPCELAFLTTNLAPTLSAR